MKYILWLLLILSSCDLDNYRLDDVNSGSKTCLIQIRNDSYLFRIEEVYIIDLENYNIIHHNSYSVGTSSIVGTRSNRELYFDLIKDKKYKIVIRDRYSSYYADFIFTEIKMKILYDGYGFYY